MWIQRRTRMSNLTLSLDASTSVTGWAVFNGSTLVQSGAIKPKSKSNTFYERGRLMTNELKMIQLRAIESYKKPFDYIVIEKNNVMSSNQQSMMSIGIVTGMILSRLVADEVYFVNVSTWRKHWKFSYKDRSKKSMKKQSIETVEREFNKTVKDDEADAILIGSYFVNGGLESGKLEHHSN